MAGRKRKADDDARVGCKTKEEKLAQIIRDLRTINLAVGDLANEPARNVALPILRDVADKVRAGDLKHHLGAMTAHGLMIMNENTSNNEDTRVKLIAQALFEQQMQDIEQAKLAVNYAEESLQAGGRAVLIAAYSLANGRINWEQLHKDIGTGLLNAGVQAGVAHARAA